MANYHFIGIQPDGNFQADVDFAACPATQYRFVTVASTAGKVKLGTGASNPMPVGVLQNSPSSGEAAQIVVVGFSKLVARAVTCVVNYGDFVLAASDGVAQTMAVGNGSAMNARWYGPAVTTGSAIGDAYIFGFAVCAVSGS